MATNASLKVIKSIPFKAGTRNYSNRYYFNGGTPPDAAHWHTLMDNVTTAEKAIHASDSHIIEAIGYAAGSDVPVASKTYSLAGTVSPAAGQGGAAGEVAALVRWSTNARTIKNHPIYLFKYFHNIWVHATVSDDLLDANQKAAMETYAGSWITGFSDGGSVTAVLASPNGALATGHQTETYVTHRDFPYTPSL